jgi:hypothetical protein
MLKTHIDAVESYLLEISNIPDNAGHSLHKGTPREAFIRGFLDNHLNKNVSIGSGEIIDQHTRPQQPRNQYDLVIYNNSYPKLDYGGGVDAFLAESVIATIEVKSKLNKKGIEQAVGAAQAAKALKRSTITSFTAGYIPPSILSYVVAYDGPARIETLHGWIDTVQQQQGIATPAMSDRLEERQLVPSPSLDGIFVLGKGFISFDNSPISFCSAQRRKEKPDTRWILVKCERGSLLYLFTLLLQASANVQGVWLDPLPYLNQFVVDEVDLRP